MRRPTVGTDGGWAAFGQTLNALEIPVLIRIGFAVLRDIRYYGEIRYPKSTRLKINNQALPINTYWGITEGYCVQLCLLINSLRIFKKKTLSLALGHFLPNIVEYALRTM